MRHQIDKNKDREMRIFFKFISIYSLLIATAYAHICEDESIVALVLEQAKIKPAERDLFDCKIEPLNSSHVIMAYANWFPEIEDREEGSFELNLIKFNKENQKLIDQYRVAEPLISDAVALENIKLDTANYKISDSSRALGVRLSYRINSSVNHFSMTLLNLYEFNKRRQILHNLIVQRYSAETDARCNTDAEERSSIMLMQNKQSNQAFDILLKSRIDHSIFRRIKGGCKEFKKPTTLQTFRVKFDGQQYQIPKAFKDDYVY